MSDPVDRAAVREMFDKWYREDGYSPVFWARLSLLPAVSPEGPAWQPIATAPQFAKMIIVAAGTPPESMFAYWNGQQSCWCRLYAHEMTPIDPTHWQPLPSPPAQATAEKETPVSQCDSVCTLPPTPWRCWKKAGHDGLHESIEGSIRWDYPAEPKPPSPLTARVTARLTDEVRRKLKTTALDGLRSYNLQLSGSVPHANLSVSVRADELLMLLADLQDSERERDTPLIGVDVESINTVLLPRLLAKIDYGGHDGWGTDDLHISAADALVALQDAAGTEQSQGLAWKKRATEAEASLAAIAPELQDAERRLREAEGRSEALEGKYRAQLWLNHGHSALYGDDGEMQCGQCAPTWDYRRAPLEQVEQAVYQAKLAALADPQAQGRETP